MSLLQTDTINLSAPTDESTEPPVFWWFNGNKIAKTPGCFYIKEAELASPPAEPWELDTRFDGEIGFSATSLKIAYIAHRAQAFTEDDSGAYKKKVWLKQWEQGARIQTDILCFVQGIEGPVVLSVKGLTGKAFTAKKDSILAEYRAGLLREASRIEGRKLPAWSFWLPISTKLTSAGGVEYADTGYKSVTTPPALFIPDLSEQTITDLFVGLDVLRYGDELRIEFDTWLKTQRGNIAPEPAPVAAAPGWDAGDGDIEF